MFKKDEISILLVKALTCITDALTNAGAPENHISLDYSPNNADLALLAVNKVGGFSGSEKVKCCAVGAFVDIEIRGKFKMRFLVANAFDILKTYKKIPDTLTTVPSIKQGGHSLSKNRYYETAADLGSLEEVETNMLQACGNAKTALQSGNKKLTDLMYSEKVKWLEIYEIAKDIDYVDIDLEKQANANSEIKALLVPYSEKIKPTKWDSWLSDNFSRPRALFDLFRKFSIAPVNDAKLVWVLYTASELFENGVQVELERLKTEIEKCKQTIKDKYLKKDGSQRLLSYKARTTYRIEETRVEKLEQKVLALEANQEEIEKYLLY